MATTTRWPSAIAIAACASIGAGGIHAAVIGTHAEHRTLALLFVWSAALQVVWGIAALLRPSTSLAVGGLVVNAVMAGAWFVSRVTAVSFVGGLEEREPIHFADAACAGLGIVVVGITLGLLLTPGAAGEHRAPNAGIPAFLVAALALPAMLIGGTTVHDHTEDPSHSHTAAADEAHSDGALTSSAVPTKPYDPTKPIDLSGVDGVTPEQQARAENLVAITLLRLPKFADYRTAEAAGWHSIGDAITGFEHFMNWDLIDDEVTLNPDSPESLVYEVGPNGKRTLVSAMYMLPQSVSLENVPDIGGRLMQWHVHSDLCFTAGPDAPRVAGITTVTGSCRPPLEKFPPAPMIHVWIVPHPCGPFAALEGVGAGQVKDGETKWCDHAHGSSGTLS
jgi:hypothetical protein